MKILAVNFLIIWALFSPTPLLYAQTPSLGQLLNGKLTRDAQRAAHVLSYPLAQHQKMQPTNSAFCKKMQTLAEIPGAVPPDVMRRHTGGPRLAEGPAADAAAQVPFESWLLEDSRFIPQFGEPYDEMSPETLQTLRRQAEGCRLVSRDSQANMMADPAFVERVFNSASFQRYAEGVRTIRAVRREGNLALRQLEDLPSSGEGAQTYQKISADVPRLRAFMGEQQQVRFNAALAGVNDRPTRPHLLEQARSATQEAEGYEGWIVLTELLRELQPEGRSVKAQSEDPTYRALKARQSDLATSLAQDERKRLDALGSGLPALERGVKWQREFTQRYGRYSPLGDLVDVQHDFIRRRSVLLEGSQAELSKLIAKASSVVQINALAQRYFPLESDRQTTAGIVLVNVMAEHSALLEKPSIAGQNGGVAKTVNSQLEQDARDQAHRDYKRELDRERAAKCLANKGWDNPMAAINRNMYCQ